MEIKKAVKPSGNFAWVGKALRHPIAIAIYYLAALVLALIYDTVQAELDARAFVWAALTVFSLVVVVVLVSALFFRIGRQEEFEDRITDMKEFINAQHMGWIVNDKYIRALEFGSEDTWVFTRNLANDLNKSGEIFEAVRSNLKAGHRYIYFVPDVPITYDLVDQFHAAHNVKAGQVTFYLVPETHFTFYTEVVVYNVETDERIAIEWLPQTELNYYIAMDREHANRLVGIGKMFRSTFDTYISPSS